MHSCTFVSPRRWRLWVFLLFALLGSPSLIAQVDGGRAAFGFNAGLAKYFGEFSDNSWWLGGDAFIRYNIVPMLALQAQFNIANPRAFESMLITQSRSTPTTTGLVRTPARGAPIPMARGFPEERSAKMGGTTFAFFLQNYFSV